MQFRVGDKVRRVKNGKGHPIVNSRIKGTVVEVSGNAVNVKWQNNRAAYWIYNVDRLELVEDDSPIAG